jgi:hypothetical protein
MASKKRERPRSPSSTDSDRGACVDARRSDAAFDVQYRACDDADVLFGTVARTGSASCSASIVPDPAKAELVLDEQVDLEAPFIQDEQLDEAGPPSQESEAASSATSDVGVLPTVRRELLFDRSDPVVDHPPALMDPIMLAAPAAPPSPSAVPDSIMPADPAAPPSAVPLVRGSLCDKWDAESSAGEAEELAPTPAAAEGSPDVHPRVVGPNLASGWDALSGSDSDSDEAAEPEQDLLDGDAAISLSDPLWLPPKAQVDIGAELWMGPVLRATEKLRLEGGTPTMPFRTTHMDCGAGCALFAMRTLGIPFQSAVSDSKQACRSFTLKHYDNNIEYCFTTNAELAQRSGFCRKRGLVVTMDRTFQSHCSTTRFPMPKRDAKEADGDNPSSYDASVQEFLGHLSLSKPLSFWIEAHPHYLGAKLASGEVAYDSFFAEARRLGYHVCHFFCPHSLFVADSPQVSMIIVAFDDRCGGVRAIDWFKKEVMAVLKAFRDHGPPCKLWSTDPLGQNDGVLGPSVVSEQCEEEGCDLVTLIHLSQLKQSLLNSDRGRRPVAGRSRPNEKQCFFLVEMRRASCFVNASNTFCHSLIHLQTV